MKSVTYTVENYDKVRSPRGLETDTRVCDLLLWDSSSWLSAWVDTALVLIEKALLMLTWHLSLRIQIQFCFSTMTRLPLTLRCTIFYFPCIPWFNFSFIASASVIASGMRLRVHACVIVYFNDTQLLLQNWPPNLACWGGEITLSEFQQGSCEVSRLLKISARILH